MDIGFFDKNIALIEKLQNNAKSYNAEFFAPNPVKFKQLTKELENKITPKNKKQKRFLSSKTIQVQQKQERLIRDSVKNQQISVVVASLCQGLAQCLEHYNFDNKFNKLLQLSNKLESEINNILNQSYSNSQDQEALTDVMSSFIDYIKLGTSVSIGDIPALNEAIVLHIEESGYTVDKEIERIVESKNKPLLNYIAQSGVKATVSKFIKHHGFTEEMTILEFASVFKANEFKEFKGVGEKTYETVRVVLLTFANLKWV